LEDSFPQTDFTPPLAKKSGGFKPMRFGDEGEEDTDGEEVPEDRKEDAEDGDAKGLKLSARVTGGRDETTAGKDEDVGRSRIEEVAEATRLVD